MSFGRITVSRDFRDFVKKELPGLADNPSYWRFFGLCVFGNTSEDGEQILISQEVLARTEGKHDLLTSANYCGLDFLEAYQRDVAPIVWSGWDHSKGEARELKSTGLPDRVLQAGQRELQTPPSRLKNRVYLEDGGCFSAARQKATRDDDREAALNFLDRAGCQEARILLEYLNHLPPNRFTKLLTNLPEAWDATKLLPNMHSQDRARSTLRSIADQPVPFYKPTKKGRTTRIFGYNAWSSPGLMDTGFMLPSPARRGSVHSQLD